MTSFPPNPFASLATSAASPSHESTLAVDILFDLSGSFVVLLADGRFVPARVGFSVLPVLYLITSSSHSAKNPLCYNPGSNPDSSYEIRRT